MLFNPTNWEQEQELPWLELSTFLCCGSFEHLFLPPKLLLLAEFQVSLQEREESPATELQEKSVVSISHQSEIPWERQERCPKNVLSGVLGWWVTAEVA